MKYRQFGETELIVSEVGFGAWAIGGPAMAGNIPIGWGKVNDEDSIKALSKAFELGINFYDTADFYGLGHSEELIGKVFGKKKEVIIASKVGHRLNNKKEIFLDYSKKYIIEACEKSLKRLNRDYIDFYQLHSANLSHLENGECIEAMQLLKESGKIRYWGVSLNTFEPFPEADFLIENSLGDGIQLVLSIMNQRSLPLLQKLSELGMGIIARMPLHFGLLTGKFNKDTKFEANDHRQFRLPPEILSESLEHLNEIWQIAENYDITKTELALSYVLSNIEISTVIPGIKTEEQAIQNTSKIITLNSEDILVIENYFLHHFEELLSKMK